MTTRIKLKKNLPAQEDVTKPNIHPTMEDPLPQPKPQSATPIPKVSGIVDEIIDDGDVDNIDSGNDGTDDVVEIDRSDMNEPEKFEGNLPFGHFFPMPSNYMMFKHPPPEPSTSQILSQLLIHDGKNIASILEDIRISLDCLTETVMKLGKTIEKNKN